MHDAGDEEDRERRECEKPNEEQFERDEIHGVESSRERSMTSRSPD